jgi:signal transduction histidine kinase
MKKEASYLTDKVFELINVSAAPEGSFKYVVLKMKKYGDSDKMLIQVIDMSDKILYAEVKAEKSFLALINAAVSHELRNPLSSLIGQIE